MKTLFNITKLSYIFLFIGIILLATGCEEYLDKAPEADLSEEDVFKDFISFQGFTEELYGCIVDRSKVSQRTDFNLGDDQLPNLQIHLGIYMDAGNYWIAMTNQNQSYFWKSDWDTKFNIWTSGNNLKAIWPLSWYGIRKANVGLANFDYLVDATQEEKNLIKGQLLFFRGYLYFELMSNWGGLPYIDWVLGPDDDMRIPRLTYQETALKAAEDLQAAADLLPVHWDMAEAGQRTLGDNDQRITKAAALAYKGKCLLYAASPLMNRESTGNANYDTELCEEAATAFAEVIKLSDQYGMHYLEPWENYDDLFYIVSAARILPGGHEVLFNSPMYNYGQSRWAIPPYVLSELGGGGDFFSPTENYVKNFGMANGLPLTDPESGYDPNDPWTGRDPRFYKTIVIDGEQIAVSPSAGVDRFAQFYTGGRHHADNNGTLTGYGIKKYRDITCNKFDNGWGGNKLQFIPPLMRMADVYLMYAESVLQGYGSATSGTSGNITAEQAVNRVRNRAQVPDVDPKYTVNKQLFMDMIMKERAVELAYEGHRWYDLRRWLLATDIKYREKTGLSFDRGEDGKPINIQERVVLTKVFDEKHYWMPLPVDDVNLYPEFGQNPGW